MGDIFSALIAYYLVNDDLNKVWFNYFVSSWIAEHVCAGPIVRFHVLFVAYGF